MAGSCTVTPGLLIPDGDIVTNAKLRQMAAPVVQVNPAQITTTELSAGVNASLAAATSTLVSVVAKSANFSVLVGDKGKLFDITTGGGSNITAALDAGTLVNGWYVWLRKADTGSKKVLTSPTTLPAAVSLSKQNQVLLIYSDGTNYYGVALGLSTIDVNGNQVISATFIGIGGNTGSFPAIKVNGTTLQFRLADDSADAPISVSDGGFSGRVYNTAYFPIGNITGAAAAIDASKGNRFLATLTGNVTGLTISNMVEGQPVVVCLLQDGTGTRTVAWTGITWGAGGTAPVQTATANKRDFYSFEKVGTTIYGSQLANF